MITKRGYIEFDRAVEQFEKKLIKRIKGIVAETAEIAVAQMKALVPVDEGNLRKSIDVTYYNGGLSAVITVGAHYGIYIEHGTGIYAENGDGRKTAWAWLNDKGKWIWTRGYPAQPFFYPSMEIAAKHFSQEMNKLG